MMYVIKLNDRSEFSITHSFHDTIDKVLEDPNYALWPGVRARASLKELADELRRLAESIDANAIPVVHVSTTEKRELIVPEPMIGAA